jgi:hypothetical protein
MAAIVQGISAIYGCGDTLVTNAVVQSYTNDGEFTSEATIVNEEGLTVAWRGDDRKTQITVEMIAKTTAMPVLGDDFTVTVNTASSYTTGAASVTFTGWVLKVSDKGSNRGYSAVSITAVGYEGVVAPE